MYVIPIRTMGRLLLARRKKKRERPAYPPHLRVIMGGKVVAEYEPSRVWAKRECLVGLALFKKLVEDGKVTGFLISAMSPDSEDERVWTAKAGKISQVEMIGHLTILTTKLAEKI